MKNLLVLSILGMGLTGAILIFSVALLFDPPIGNGLMMVTAASLTAFVLFTISALVLRRRLNH